MLPNFPTTSGNDLVSNAHTHVDHGSYDCGKRKFQVITEANHGFPAGVLLRSESR